MTRKEEIMCKAGSIVDGMISNNVPSEICDSYYQGFIEGAKWADEIMIEKACDWLLKGWYFVNNTETINDFKKAMEL